MNTTALRALMALCLACLVPTSPPTADARSIRAQPMACNQEVKGRLSNDAYVQEWTFQGVAGQQVGISIQSNARAQMTIQLVQGTSLGDIKKDLGRFPAESGLVASLPQSDTYTIAVFGPAPGKSTYLHEYLLALRCASPGTPLAPATASPTAAPAALAGASSQLTSAPPAAVAATPSASAAASSGGGSGGTGAAPANGSGPAGAAGGGGVTPAEAATAPVVPALPPAGGDAGAPPAGSPSAAGQVSATAQVTATGQVTPTGGVTPTAAVTSTAGVAGTTGVSTTAGLSGTAGITATASVSGTPALTATAGITTTLDPGTPDASVTDPTATDATATVSTTTAVVVKLPFTVGSFLRWDGLLQDYQGPSSNRAYQARQEFLAASEPNRLRVRNTYTAYTPGLIEQKQTDTYEVLMDTTTGEIVSGEQFIDTYMPPKFELAIGKEFNSQGVEWRVSAERQMTVMGKTITVWIVTNREPIGFIDPSAPPTPNGGPPSRRFVIPRDGIQEYYDQATRINVGGQRQIAVYDAQNNVIGNTLDSRQLTDTNIQLGVPPR